MVAAEAVVLLTALAEQVDQVSLLLSGDIMSRYVLVDATGLVVNVIMLDGNENWHNHEYTAIQSDTADIGWTYSNGVFSAPPQEIPSLTDDQLAEEARSKRDALIAKTDYLFRQDYPITAERLERFKAYSQLLRDITKQSGFPKMIDWPPMPE